MTTHYFKGIAKWAKVHTPDKKYGHYSINVYMDPDNLAAYTKSGIQVAVKEDEEGKFVTFRRSPKKLIKGELVDFGGPAVFNAEGTPLKEDVGNGSDVTVKVTSFETAKGVGHRLESVLVNNLVEYSAGKIDTGAMGEDFKPF